MKNEKNLDENVLEEVEQEEKEIDLNQEDELALLKAEIERLKNQYALAYADTENIKKRLQKEADDLRKYRAQSFILEILPVIDNLERAMMYEEGKNDGVKMIYDQLIKALENEGVKKIEALDKPFDPNFMQAVMKEEKQDVESDIVIEVLQNGYLLKDRMLRPAMVKVSQ